MYRCRCRERERYTRTEEKQFQSIFRLYLTVQKEKGARWAALVSIIDFLCFSKHFCFLYRLLLLLHSQLPRGLFTDLPRPTTFLLFATFFIIIIFLFGDFPCSFKYM